MTQFLPAYFRNRFWRFISDPEEPPRLQRLFDNLRNYTIVALVLAAGVLASNGLDYRERTAGSLLLAFGAMLLVLNGLQLFAWQIRAVHTWLGFSTLELFGGAGTWRTQAKLLLLSIPPLLFTVAIWVLVSFLVESATLS